MAEKPKGNVETTGHSWDGIEELNNPLPRWWLWTFYATILWGVIYTIAYPAWPLINGATQGFLGYSTRGELATALAEHEAKNAERANALAEADLAAMEPGSDLYRYAVARGAAAFRTNCTTCHGAGAAGVQSLGYPNLLDDDWLWGGEVDTIATTIRHGIRTDTDDDSRWSEMPAFGDILAEEEIAAVTGHVLSLSGRAPASYDAALGAQVFADNCAGCHGDDGKGDRSVGAPNLTDAIWLYGGSPEAVATTIRRARFGVMPAWGQRLPAADVNALAVYVHSLGGGE